MNILMLYLGFNNADRIHTFSEEKKERLSALLKVDVSSMLSLEVIRNWRDALSPTPASSVGKSEFRQKLSGHLRSRDI